MVSNSARRNLEGTNKNNIIYRYLGNLFMCVNILKVKLLNYIIIIDKYSNMCIVLTERKACWWVLCIILTM